MDWQFLLAQLTSSPTSAPSNPTPTGGDTFFTSLLPILLMIGVFYFIMFRGQRKEQKKSADMLAAIKKGDRVQTIGGILGTVADVRDDEIVVKVDESNNIKMRFVRGAIKTVLNDPAPADRK